MPSLDELIEQDKPEVRSFEQHAEEVIHEPEIVEGRTWTIPEWVKAKTGSGPIESYINHPLNFKQSRGMAQILRGLTGIIGTLEYALLDVFLGVLQFGKERRSAAQVIGGLPHGSEIVN